MDWLPPGRRREVEAVLPEKRGPARPILAAGCGIAVVLGVIWIARLPLATFLLRQEFGAPLAPARLELTRLDFSGVTARDIQLGPATAPDFAARSIGIDFAWRGLSPTVKKIEADSAMLRVRLAPKGVSFGVLDKALKGGSGKPTAPRAALPNLSIEAKNLEVQFDTPLGAFAAKGDAHGDLRRAFVLDARVAPTTTRGADGGIDNIQGALHARTTEGVFSLSFEASAASAQWQGGAAKALRANVAAKTDIELAAAVLDTHVDIAQLTANDASLSAARLTLHAEPNAFDGAFAPKSWTARGEAEASFAAHSFGAKAARLELIANGEGTRFSGDAQMSATQALAAGVVARQATLSGPVSGDFAGGALSMTARGDFNASKASASTKARADFLRAIPSLGGTPVGPLMQSARAGIDTGLTDFSITAPLALTWNAKTLRVSAPASVKLESARGANATLTPLNQTQPTFALDLIKGDIDGAATLSLSGGGLPKANLTATSFRRDRTGMTLHGALTISDWRSQDSALRADNVQIDLESNSFAVRGTPVITGPLAGMRLVDAKLPLDLSGDWRDGWRVRQRGGCLTADTRALDAFGFTFTDARIPLCPHEGEELAAADGTGALRGGFRIAPLTLAGSMAGQVKRPTILTIGPIDSRLGGKIASMALDTTIAAPKLAIDWDKTRHLDLKAQQITANLRNGKGWRVDGVLTDVWIEDSTAPARLERFNGIWNAAPQGDLTVVKLERGAGRLFDWHSKTVVSPMRVKNVSGELRNGRARATGDIALEQTGQTLGVFEATHNVNSGVGDGQTRARDLVFSSALQPYQISETMRGVVEDVRGPIDADINAHWGVDFRADARFDLKSLDMATAALGPTQAVVGEIKFNDFLKLTTAPGQVIQAGSINPGVAVTDGKAQFHLAPDLHLAIEDARWPFAGGSLSVLPTVVNLKSDEIAMTLSLQEVDVGALTKQLNVKGLTATGEVEGQFPLVFKGGKGKIVHGRLTAAPQGGVIQYDSDFVKGGGAAQMAFGALRSFRYDKLSIDLDGDLDGELVTQIAFTGVNREPIDQKAGPGTMKIVGIPFKFGVTVRAPFVALSRTAASFNDATGIIRGAKPDINVDVKGEPKTPATPSPP